MNASRPGRVHAWLRNNVLGLVAIFIALSGSAVAAQVATQQGATAAKAKKGPRGPAGPAGTPGANGAPGPQGLTGPSTGQAFGDLTGNYPSPQIAPNAVTSGKINDGAVAEADLAPRASVSFPTLDNCVGATPWVGGPAFASQPGYWRDAFGVVHLQGAVGCAGDAAEPVNIFTLPYAPDDGNGGLGIERYAVLGSGGVLAQIAVTDSGVVVYDGPPGAGVDDYVSLSGITFRAFNP